MAIEINTRRSVALAAAGATLCIAVVGVYWLWRRPQVTIGVEGTRVVEIAGPQLHAAPFTPGDAVSLRIAEATPIVGGYRYDLRYVSYGPGKHELTKHLIDADGNSPAARPEFIVEADSILPADHGGDLFDTPPSTIDLHSGYTAVMWLLWGSWALLLAPLVMYGRHRRRRAAPSAPPPTVAARLRALLEQAAHENLSVEQQADLEQLLLAFWSKRLNLSEARLSETLAQLQSHPQAGPQWQRVERWFHRRPRPENGAIARELLHDLDSL